MQTKSSGWDDTIVAIATPPGISALGVLRISGARTYEIMNRLFHSKDLALEKPNTIHVGYLRWNDDILDEVVISLFRSPASYTGEDVIEISCHGSPFVQQQVLNAIMAEGARLAKPGEFTQRAFLNGKLGLTEAEAVGDLIESNTAAARHAAINKMRGGFSKVLSELRTRLITFSSLIELELDFSEEDVEFADRKQLQEILNELEQNVTSLLQSFKLGNVIKNGVSVAIIGLPNAGKSTLLNTLLNENRAIVSEIAGTTRDTIEEILNIEGILFRLIDTTGIRDHTQDVIESMGVVKSREKISQADIVLYLFDLNETSKQAHTQILDELLAENKPLISVANKSDLSGPDEIEKYKSRFPDTIFISAKEKNGIEGLKQKLFYSAAGNTKLSENIVVTNARHCNALKEVSLSLEDIRKGVAINISGDLLSLDIRRCLHYLGEITGEVTNEDLLDYIFSKFCIGK
ncbi:tRNA uridine-5-carboxymethylaminomethyl(34) synthesis GTPase MnmE [soil metagenome]